MRKKILALTLVFVLLCSVMLPGSTVLPDWLQASDASLPLSEEKVYCNATLEDDFVDDRVIVVLNNKASTSLRTYTKADFSGIGCTKVQLLNPYTTEQINAKLTGKSEEVQRTAEPNVITFAEFEEVDTENFRQILCLTLETPGKQNVLDAIDALMKHPDVISAEPDYIITACAVNPSDPMNGQQWAIDKIQLRNAWSWSLGSGTIRVGILDSGIDGGHPELEDQINVPLSRDFTGGSAATVTSVTDPLGHGTHVAGILAAIPNNNEGISGVCYDVELVSLRVIKANNTGSISWFVSALDYAQSIQLPILNVSGGWAGTGLTALDDNAVSNALNRYSGLVVCAAGNSDSNISNTQENIDINPIYPAAFSHSRIIAVGASTRTDTCLSTSNYGPASVDLFAPGDDILSCYPRNLSSNSGTGYCIKDGTSMATPYVTGVAVLILAKYPTLTASQIKTRIMESVDTSSGLTNKCVTGGRLNAYKAVHPHSFTYTTNGITKHTKNCYCGLSLTENHTYRSSGSGYACAYCGQTTMVLPYSFDYPESTE